MQLHLGEYDTCLEAVYAYDHAIVGIRNWLTQTGKKQLPSSFKANLKWSDFGGLNTLSGSPDMYGSPLYKYLLTMAASPTATKKEISAKRSAEKKKRSEKKAAKAAAKEAAKVAAVAAKAAAAAIDKEEEEDKWWFKKLLKKSLKINRS